MRRRAADSDRHTFELVEGLDDALDPDVAGVVGSAPEGDARVAAERGQDGSDFPVDGPTAATLRRRRRVLLASVAAVAVVLGGMVAVDAVTTRQDEERLVEATGGIASAAQEPQVAWEHAIDLSTESLTFGPGTFVVSEGDDVVGYDLDTGAETWRRTFDGPTTCGTPSLWYAATPGVPEDELVCVPGTAQVVYDDDGEHRPMAVTVLAADGSVVAEHEVDRVEGPDPTGREAAALDDVRWLQAVPGPGGVLLWTGRAGPEPALQGSEVTLDADAAGVQVRGEPGDVVVAVQDVASGEVRWHATVPARRPGDDPYACVQLGDASWEGTTPETGVLDLDQVWSSTGAGLVTVQGCGVLASFGADGVRLDDPDEPDDVGVRVGDRYVRDPTGGAYGSGQTGLVDASGEPVHSSVLAADGSVDWVAPGLLVLPVATDGRSSQWFSTRTDDGALVALDGSGAQQWHTSTTAGLSDQVLVATRDTVLVPTPKGFAGLDAGTGRARWTLEPADDEDAPAPGTVWQAFTDGRLAVLQTNGGTDSRLVAVDLADGRVVWAADDVGDGYWGLLAVQGRLVRYGEQSIALVR
nr:PQQ-binding-like beta-propeller repeat protein [Cellulosimicrobium arenosum]